MEIYPKGLHEVPEHTNMFNMQSVPGPCLLEVQGVRETQSIHPTVKWPADGATQTDEQVLYKGH